MEPTFLDRFIAHLAARLLLDLDRIQSWLKDAIDSSLSLHRRLYWRSNVLHQPEDDWKEDDGNVGSRMAFLDSTFEVVMKQDETEPLAELRVRFGYLFLDSSRNSSRYVQCKPLTQSNLDMLAKSIGLDLSTGPPQAMAMLVAQALHTISRDNSDKVTFLEHHVKDGGLLYFSDAETWGEWELAVESTSVLDTVATSLLYFNMRSTSTEEPTGSPLDTSDEVLLERRLVEFWEQLQARRLKHNLCDADRSSNPSEVPWADLATSSNSVADATSGGKRPAPTTKYGKYVSVVDGTKNRKKKGKITYAKPS